MFRLCKVILHSSCFHYLFRQVYNALTKTIPKLHHFCYGIRHLTRPSLCLNWTPQSCIVWMHNELSCGRNQSTIMIQIMSIIVWYSCCAVFLVLYTSCSTNPMSTCAVTHCRGKSSIYKRTQSHRFCRLSRFPSQLTFLRYKVCNAVLCMWSLNKHRWACHCHLKVSGQSTHLIQTHESM